MIRAEENALAQIMSPFGHGVENGKPFLVEHRVVALRLRKSSAEVVDRVSAVSLLLLHNCNYSGK